MTLQQKILLVAFGFLGIFFLVLTPFTILWTINITGYVVTVSLVIREVHRNLLYQEVIVVEKARSKHEHSRM